MEDGKPTPELDDAPQIPPSLLWAYSDFCLLETERSIGMGLGPIPVTRMYDYLDRTDTDPEFWPECVLYWTALDGESRSHMAEKMPKPKMPEKPSGAGRNSISRADYPES